VIQKLNHVALLLACVCWPALSGPAAEPAKQPPQPSAAVEGSEETTSTVQPDSSLDDALLEALFENDKEAAETPDGDAKADMPTDDQGGKEGAPEPADGPAGDAAETTPGEQGQQPAGTRPAPAGGPSHEALDELDRQLLEGLGEDVSPAAEPGAEEDPIFRLNRLMREVEERMAREGADQEVLDRQQKIADELARLLRELQQQRRQQQQSSSSARPSSRRQRVQQPSQPSGRQSAQEAPAREATEKLRERQAGKPDSRQLEELFKDVWGNLPEKERERLMQSYREEFLEAYRTEIEAYFNALVKRRFGNR